MRALALAPALLLPALSAAAAQIPTNAFGVNLHPPAKLLETNQQDWREFDALLAQLPEGTPVRVSTYYHEWIWDKRFAYGFENVAAKVKALAKSKLPVTWEVTPLPWPGSFAWAPAQIWGAVAVEDFPELDRRFKLFVSLLRKEMKAAGMPEAGTRIHLGNEPGSTHPGGNSGLPVGEWYDRHGVLYERMVKGTDFGGIQLVLPALSFQDHEAGTAKRERDSAGPILRKIARAKTAGGAVAAIHHRLYAPQLGTEAYAAEWLRLLETRLELARTLSQRPYSIATEVYIFREDRGASDDRPEILRLVAPKLPRGVYLYRVGGGPNDPSTQLPVSAVRAARSAASAGS